MLSGSASGSPRRLIALVLAMTLVPLILLFWLGWQVLQQDRMIEARQRGDRVERAADLVVAALQRAIAGSEQRLAAGYADWPASAVSVTFGRGVPAASPPGRLAYLPVVPVRDTPAGRLKPAEDLEFLQADRLGAIEAYRRLSLSSDPAVRGVALLRMGRNLAALGKSGDALHVYGEALNIAGAWEGGVPAGLVARYMRCVIFEASGEKSALQSEAQQLERELDSGRWAITGPVHGVYAPSAAAWLGSVSAATPPLSVVFSEAAAHQWSTRQSDPGDARETLTIGGVTLTVLQQRAGDATRLLIASPAFVQSEWLPPAAAVAREQRVSLQLRSPDGRALISSQLPAPPSESPAAGIEVLRPAAQADLPWTVAVAGDGMSADWPAFARRRQLLITGFAVLLMMALGAGYLIVRSVSREFEVGRLQSDFVSAVSHEFRTPLTTLRQFTERLREQPDLPQDQQRQCYEAQSRATGRLTRLVESILDFGRMEAGARPYRLEPIDCSAFVQQVVRDFALQPEAAGRSIAFESSGSLPIEADEQALARAIWNLLDNAVKYSPDGGPVDVALRRRGEHVAVTVRDRGLGIAAHERRAIFERFRRGEQARVRGIKGTGIGLAMVQQIVAAHQGRVELASEPGQGSTFTILLPARGGDSWPASS